MSCPYYSSGTDPEGDIRNLCRVDYDGENMVFGTCYCYGNELECEKKIETLVQTNHPEYLKHRCCMCPNINEPYNTVCPPKPFNPKNTACRFVKTYMDKRGWRYKVMGGLGENNYKARYQKPGKTGWKCMPNLEWRKSFDEAQSDLNAMAKLKKWSEI